jgi:hypothetical protein
MLRLLHYYSKYQSAKGAWGGLPVWARWLLFLAALPGLGLLLLSIAAFFVSLLALLLLTVPLYRALRWVAGTEPEPQEMEAPLGSVDFVEPAEPVQASSPTGEVRSGGVTVTAVEPPVELTPVSPQGRRQIEVRIVE